MLKISAETYAKNGIETLFDCLKNYWLDEKHTENTIGRSVWRNITKNITFKIQATKTRISRLWQLSILQNDKKTSIKSNNALQSSRIIQFYVHDVIDTKKQSVLGAIKRTFKGEIIQTRYSLLGYKIDLYFHDYKLAIDEYGHNDKNIDYETKRQKQQKKNLDVNLLELTLMNKILLFLEL